MLIVDILSVGNASSRAYLRDVVTHKPVEQRRAKRSEETHSAWQRLGSRSEIPNLSEPLVLSSATVASPTYRREVRRVVHSPMSSIRLRDCAIAFIRPPCRVTRSQRR